MTLIANLAVALTAQTGQFSSKLQGAGKDVTNFASGVQHSAHTIMKAFEGFVAAFAVEKIFEFTKAITEAVQQNLNLSLQLQSTYKEMMALRLGAEEAGGSIEGITKAMESMQEKLGKGDKGVEDALSKLGLKDSDLLGKGAFKQISLISEAFTKLGSSETKAAVGAELFGKANRELQAFLTKGPEALEEGLRNVDKVGLSLSDASADKLVALKVDFDELTNSFKGLFTQLVVLLATPFHYFTIGLSGIVQGFTLLVGVIGDVSSAIETATLHLANFLTLGMSKSVAEAIGNNRALSAIGEQPGPKQIAAMNAKRLDDIAKADAANKASGGTFGAEADVNAQNARDAAFGAARTIREEGEIATTIFWTALRGGGDVLLKGFQAGLPKLANFLQNASMDTPEFRKELLRRQTDAMNPMSELIASGFLADQKLSKPISQAASAGTRGTFAADSAGRMSPSFIIEQKQLEVQQDISKGIRDLNANFENGVPVG